MVHYYIANFRMGTGSWYRYGNEVEGGRGSSLWSKVKEDERTVGFTDGSYVGLHELSFKSTNPTETYNDELFPHF